MVSCQAALPRRTALWMGPSSVSKRQVDADGSSPSSLLLLRAPSWCRSNVAAVSVFIYFTTPPTAPSIRNLFRRWFFLLFLCVCVCVCVKERERGARRMFHKIASVTFPRAQLVWLESNLRALKGLQNPIRTQTASLSVTEKRSDRN